MYKKLISLLMIVCVMTTIFTPGYTSRASAYPRNGFRLVAVESDFTGISIDTEFLLETEKDFTLQQVKDSFSIDGEPDPIIEELDKNFFSINLVRPLLENTVYTFRMTTDVETTWVFQTQTKFEIVGSLPGNQSIGVPTNSGIEIYFSHSNFSDIKDHFEITPPVSGRFQVSDKTAVFVPNNRLEEETVYTVKIKKGIQINGTERVINDDYIFSFETRSKETSPPNQIERELGINYNQQITDFSPDEEITVSLRYFNRNTILEIPHILNTSVYAYSDFESFLEAFKIRNKYPEWAQINYNNTFLPVDNLQKVLEFNQSIDEFGGNSGNASIKIPQKLPVGYYILDSYCLNKRAQKFIQVTNTSIYITKGSEKTLVWINDMESKQPLANAQINFSSSDDAFYTDSKGIATFNSDLIDNMNTDNSEYNDFYYFYYAGNYNKQLMTVTTANGNKSLLDTSSYSYGSNNDYWRYFFTDRGMYKPNDTINVWGFIKNRYQEEEINYLTLEITQGYWWGSSNLPLVKEKISVKDNFFEGEINLPNLPRGYYTILLKKDNITITSSGVQIENYVKPSYKMSISKDKVAAFIGDEVTFNINAAFFEGTGVPNLNTSYTISTHSLNGMSTNQNAVTDSTGNLKVKYIPEVNRDVQGIYSIPIGARALLPETGEISASNSVRVFVNDIDVQRSGEIKDGIGNIDVTVHEIVLDRLNDGSATHSNDYLGSPVNSKEITGTIYKNTWIKEQTGTYYDSINKVTYNTYRYRRETTPIEDFKITTSSNGKASYIFDAPKLENTYYSADISCVDNSGRNMSFRMFIGERIEYSTHHSNTYNLRTDKNNYKLNENVELNFTFGNTNLPDGNYIYILSQNRIMDYETSNKSTYNFKFDEKHMPNVHATAIYFTGSTYITASRRVNYNTDEKKLIVEGKTDKDSYRPGEIVNLSLNVTDIDGNPVKATVNASIVDEAFFSLRDQNVNILSMLYTSVGSGIYYSKRSHVNNISSSNRDVTIDEALPSMPSAPSSPLAPENSDGKSDVRSDFRDTAKFISVQTDSSGKGEISFKLPDNVTSWRITMSAISRELQGGSETTNMIVTLPFFINYSFNSSYLKGDQPVMAVNAYGTGLKENDEVYFEVYDEKNPDAKFTFKGNAFERVNIPLWTLEEGYYNLIIRAYTMSGFSDAVLHPINVVESYYQLERAEFTNVFPSMDIKAGDQGYTRLVFQDRSKGMYFSELVRLYSRSGSRIDQIISKYLASELLNKHFSESYFAQVIDMPDLSEYQKHDGGLSLLPYSESDLDLTAKLSVFAKDMVNIRQLKDYFYSNLDNNTTRIKALYGLATLKEPVLLMLNEAEKIDNLSILDTIYLALSYYELGDYSKANEIYDQRISKHVESYTPYYRVNTRSTNDNILEATSICAYLAAILDRPEKTGLYEYCLINFSRDILINTEKLLFITEEIDKDQIENSTFTYSYDGNEKLVELNYGRSYHLNLLPHQLQNFKITDVNGNVALVTIFKEDVFDITEVNDQISISRSYHFTNGAPINSNTLKQGDIIKVRLNWNISDNAFNGVYEITDYLPSGLKPYRSLWNVEGQKVTFYVFNSPYWRSNPYIEYYARVVSPGVYTAQGPVIQGRTSRDIINSGKTQIVTIETDELISKPIDPPPVTPTPDPILYGDLNGDGKINSTDFVLLRRYLLGIIDEFSASEKAADLNGDGKINSTDLVLLRRYLLVIIDRFPVEQT
ncbi:UNVERIFIED_CONTAM: hypothetical protein Cloal_1829 [Acetivibrio alkalicellulosi]